jgi:hypothetical protein
MTRSSSIPEGPASSRPGRARRRLVLVAGAIVVAFPILALASPLDIPNEFAAGDMISADAFNENFEMVAASVNDNDARIAALEAAVASIAGAPAGGVVFFNLATCPEGWIELQAMRGRVPLGLPAGGTFGDVVGDELDPQGTVTITQVPTHTHTSGGLTATASTNTHGHSLSGGGTHKTTRSSRAADRTTTRFAWTSAAGSRARPWAACWIRPHREATRSGRFRAAARTRTASRRAKARTRTAWGPPITPIRSR